MKKSIETLKVHLSKTDNGELKGGFASIKGGFSLQAVQVNGGICDNSAICTGTNQGTCSNTGDCTQTSNQAGSCTNKNACFI